MLDWILGLTTVPGHFLGLSGRVNRRISRASTLTALSPDSDPRGDAVPGMRRKRLLNSPSPCLASVSIAVSLHGSGEGSAASSYLGGVGALRGEAERVVYTRRSWGRRSMAFGI